MENTTIYKKIADSIINILFVLIFFLPFYFFIEGLLIKKLILIGIFLIYNASFLLTNQQRCLGIIFMKTKYAEKYSKPQFLIYNILYTLSFSTLLFWIFFPLDLFLFNILFLQLPAIIFKRTTFHGYLSGNIKTVKK